MFNKVWVIARMMFARQHDLLLATVLLVFASGYRHNRWAIFFPQP